MTIDKQKSLPQLHSLSEEAIFEGHSGFEVGKVLFAGDKINFSKGQNKFD